MSTEQNDDEIQLNVAFLHTPDGTPVLRVDHPKGKDLFAPKGPNEWARFRVEEDGTMKKSYITNAVAKKKIEWVLSLVVDEDEAEEMRAEFSKYWEDDEKSPVAESMQGAFLGAISVTTFGQNRCIQLVHPEGMMKFTPKGGGKWLAEDYGPDGKVTRTADTVESKVKKAVGFMLDHGVVVGDEKFQLEQKIAMMWES